MRASSGYGSGDLPMPIVTGQDAEIPSVKSIIAGEQYSTVFMNTREPEIGRNGVILWNEATKRTRALLARVGLSEHPVTRVEKLGVGKQPLVEMPRRWPRTCGS